LAPATRSLLALALLLASSCDGACSAIGGTGVASSGFGIQNGLEAFGPADTAEEADTGEIPAGTPLVFLDACDMDGDGVHDCANTGWTDGEVQSAVDPWLDTGSVDGDLGDADVADQSNYDAEVVLFGNKPGIYFDATDYLTSDALAAAYAWMLATGDDHGCVVVFAANGAPVAAQRLLATSTATPNNRFQLGLDADGITLRFQSNATNHVALVGTNLPTDPEDPTFLAWNYKGDDGAATDEIAVWINDMVTVVVDDALVSPPTAGSVSETLRAGRNTHDTNADYDGWIHLFYCRASLLSEAERVAFKLYVETRMGITF
jgi:hypothetical protein